MNGCISLDNEQIMLKPDYPQSWAGRRFPNAHPFCWSDDSGHILVQRLDTKGCRLHYAELYFSREVTIGFHKADGLQSVLALKGSLQGQLDGQEVAVGRGEFILIGGKNAELKAKVPAGKACQLWLAHYAQALYQGLDRYFPQLRQLRDLILFTPQPRPAREQVLRSIYDQFTQQFAPGLQEVYAALKAKEALICLLEQAQQGAASPALTEREREIAAQAHALILKDIRVHYSNIDLARKLHINEADLKRIFKQQYGVGLFGLLQQARFEKARLLLTEERLQIKQVAARIGYRHTTTFITEFRRYFGYTPLDLQKGRRS